MSLITSDDALPYRRLSEALNCLLRPAVGFHTPFDVLKDPLLDICEKRAILASWASDASAVKDHPSLRWLIGTDEPVPLNDVRAALWRLDELDDSLTPTFARSPVSKASVRNGALSYA
jgi:hypothetical protein